METEKIIEQGKEVLIKRVHGYVTELDRMGKVTGKQALDVTIQLMDFVEYLSNWVNDNKGSLE